MTAKQKDELRPRGWDARNFSDTEGATVSQQPLGIWQGYFDLSAAIVARAMKSCLVHCEQGFRAHRNPHGAPEGKERPADAWAWLTGRGTAIRLEAELIYDCCDIDAPRILSLLWEQMQTINAELADELEDAQTEEPRYDFRRYTGGNRSRLSQQGRDQQEPAVDIREESATVRTEIHPEIHPAIVQSDASVAFWDAGSSGSIAAAEVC